MLIGFIQGDAQNLHCDCSVKDDILENCVTDCETQCYSILRGQLKNCKVTIQLCKYPFSEDKWYEHFLSMREKIIFSKSDYCAPNNR